MYSPYGLPELKHFRLISTALLAHVLVACGYSHTPALSSLQGIESAVVRIVSQGTFIDPEFGVQFNAPGTGSGFIIDPSGLAVTNNHVIAGAALLNVWISGETNPRNARVVGYSECWDLALIEIDGEGFKSLEFSEDSPGVGAPVFAAGYPLGDSQFTLTSGIVSKISSDGDTAWASVDEVLVHDAALDPGSSGGPLVDSNGSVVGVNFAKSSLATNQNFALTGRGAQSVIERLRAGDNVDSVGINGAAIASEDSQVAGIWVSSVVTGSSADQLGIQPGDLIISMEGLFLGLDGTMSGYCEVLRSHSPNDKLAVFVARIADGELLEGQLNGTELSRIGSLGGPFDCPKFGQWWAETRPLIENLFGSPANIEAIIIALRNDQELLEKYDQIHIRSVYDQLGEIAPPADAQSAHSSIRQGLFFLMAADAQYDAHAARSSSPLFPADPPFGTVDNQLRLSGDSFSRALSEVAEALQSCG